MIWTGMRVGEVTGLRWCDIDLNAVTLSNFSDHSLRHTFMTRMCEAGVNVKAMQDILGHAETTLQIYADATNEMKKAEMIHFNNYFNGQN